MHLCEGIDEQNTNLEFEKTKIRKTGKTKSLQRDSFKVSKECFGKTEMSFINL